MSFLSAWSFTRYAAYLASNDPCLNIGVEILTGETPFEEWHDCSVLLKLQRGERPARPENNKVSDSLWKLIDDCWARNPLSRPHTQDIVLRLSQGLERGGRLTLGWGNSSSQPTNVCRPVSLDELRLILDAPAVA